MLLAIATYIMSSGIHIDVIRFAFLIISGYMALSGAAVLNSYLDRDIDALMSRTYERPIPSGKMNASHAMWTGIGLIIAGLALSYTEINLLTALIIGTGCAVYLLIYTAYVKRSTPSAVIIGGIAGAIPAYGGWAAYGAGSWIEPTIVFLVVFFWQPAHFWFLSSYYEEDYKKVNVPVLPVLMERRGVMQRALLYTVIVVALTYLLAVESGLSLFFLTLLTLINAVLLFFSIRALSGSRKFFRSAFLYTVAYMVVFLLMLIASSIMGKSMLMTFR